MTSDHADLLELLVRFDELTGYKSSGANHCAAWINTEIGISVKVGWEYLRVGRKLRLLPTTTALFRAGKLSWSKIRVLVNVADSENEEYRKNKPPVTSEPPHKNYRQSRYVNSETTTHLPQPAA